MSEFYDEYSESSSSSEDEFDRPQDRSNYTTDSETSDDTEDAKMRDALFRNKKVVICGVSIKKETVKSASLIFMFILTLLFGGVMFRLIERNEEKIRNSMHAEKYIRDKNEILRILRQYNPEYDEVVIQTTYESLQNYVKGLSGTPSKENAWDFTQSMIFSFTIISTIGYGNFVPKTQFGKMFLVLYAIMGIPIAGLSLGFIAERAMYVLTKLSQVRKDKALEAFKHFDQDGSNELDEKEFKAALEELGFNVTPEYFTKVWRSLDEDGSGTVDLNEFRIAIRKIGADLTKAAGEKNKIVLACFGLLAWIIGGMLTFAAVENWNYQTSFYFLFVSLTTIGLGDFFPESEIGKSLLVLFCIVGLGMVAMLISLLESYYAEKELKREELLKRKKQIRDIKKLLRPVHTFEQFSDDDFENILKNAPVIEYRDDTTFIQKGKKADTYNFLLKGEVIMEQDLEGEQLISSPACLATAYIRDENHVFTVANVRSKGDVKIVSIQRNDIDQVLISKDINHITPSKIEINPVVAGSANNTTNEISSRLINKSGSERELDINLIRLLDKKETIHEHNHELTFLEENRRRTGEFIY